MKKYWLSWSVPGCYGEEDGEQEFATLEAAVGFANAKSASGSRGIQFRLIEGREIQLKKVETVTRWEAETAR